MNDSSGEKPQFEEEHYTASEKSLNAPLLTFHLLHSETLPQRVFRNNLAQ